MTIIQLEQVEFQAVATDAGVNPLASEVTVTVYFEDSADDLPPNWENVNGIRIDDLTGIEVDENIATGTTLDLSLRAVLPGTSILPKLPKSFSLKPMGPQSLVWGRAIM